MHIHKDGKLYLTKGEMIMNEMLYNLGHMIITIICSVIASSGFWAYIQKRRRKKERQKQNAYWIGT